MATSSPSDPMYYLPSWDDRKEIVYEVFQNHCPISDNMDTRGPFAEALIAVAAWGYRQRMEEEKLG